MKSHVNSNAGKLKGKLDALHSHLYFRSILVLGIQSMFLIHGIWKSNTSFIVGCSLLKLQMALLSLRSRQRATFNTG